MQQKWLIGVTATKHPQTYIAYEAHQKVDASRSTSVSVDVEKLAAFLRLFPDTGTHLEIELLVQAAFELGMQHQRRLDREARKRKNERP